MSETERTCTTACDGRGSIPPEISAATARWLRIAVALVAGTMIYNIVEAVIATVWGSRAESIALFGFGLDSIIECAAATVMLWRLVVQLRQASGEEVERKPVLDRKSVV